MRDREPEVIERPKDARPAELPRECSRVRLEDIRLDDLTYQLRIETRVGDLKQSLEENGQLEPVHLLGPPPFRVIEGFRRCTAAKTLGWTEVLAFVHENLDDLQAFKLAFLHNVVRKNLRAIDKANAIRLAQKRGMKLLDAAAELGLSEKQARRYVSLLKLPSDVQCAIDESDFTMAHALVVAEFAVANVSEMVAEVKAKKTTARELRRRLRTASLKGKRAKGRPRQLVVRDGNRLRFHSGEVSLSAPQEELDQLASQLVQFVALLTRAGVSGERHRATAQSPEATSAGMEETEGEDVAT